MVHINQFLYHFYVINKQFDYIFYSIKILYLTPKNCPLYLQKQSISQIT